jgi:predicted dehydrogenase
MRIGILGAGNIATKMAQTLTMMTTAKAAAAASRDYGRAKAFADKYGIPKAYGSYEELFQDPDVDLVYIATPHSHHYEQMMAALNHGKNILCEKAFTANAVQAKEILDLGEKKKLLVAEAIWTRYMPMRKVMDEVLAQGLIGKAHILTANLGYPVHAVERLARPELAGGALLDMGVYPINFALMTFGGDIKHIDSTVVKYHTGVDAQSSITFTYGDDRMAILYCSMLSRPDRLGVVSGEKGYIEFININNCAGIHVYNTEDERIASYETPRQLTGFEYQIESCRKAIEAGSTECPEMPHAEILKVMDIMDQLRKDWGLRYPFE